MSAVDFFLSIVAMALGAFLASATWLLGLFLLAAAVASLYALGKRALRRR